MSVGIWSNEERVSPEESFELGYDTGFAHGEDYWRAAEQVRILKELKDYYELTRFSEKSENASPNEDWTDGFFAALTFVHKEAEES